MIMILRKIKFSNYYICEDLKIDINNELTYIKGTFSKIKFGNIKWIPKQSNISNTKGLKVYINDNNTIINTTTFDLDLIKETNLDVDKFCIDDRTLEFALMNQIDMMLNQMLNHNIVFHFKNEITLLELILLLELYPKITKSRKYFKKVNTKLKFLSKKLILRLIELNK